MKSGLTVAGLFALGAVAATSYPQRVVHMPFTQERSAGIPPQAKVKRDTVLATLGNARSLYYANASVGTPPQDISFQVDTGSADIWMISNTAEFCQGQTYGIPNCPFGTFDSSSSSSANVIDPNGFQIQYVDGSGAEGAYFTDTFRLGGVEVQGQQMGLAETSKLGQGIIGLAFPETESICAQRRGVCMPYPTLTQNMVQNGQINTQAYSLWLNDLGASEGSILFGGIDTDKYVGDLVQLPLQPDAFSGGYTSFTVAWTGLTVDTPDGPLDEEFVPSSFSAPAIFDSGTTIMLLPEDTTQKIYEQVGAFISQEIGVAVAPCYFADTNITFNFQFGGSDGPVISVLLGEFLLDLGTDLFGNALTFENGDVACQFGIMSGGDDSPILFGDTFLRSAYVVYDIDNRSLSIAQTDFNSTTSNVVEITSQSGVPNVVSTASGVSASQTATGIPRPGSGMEGTGGSNDQGSASDIGTLSAPPLASFTNSAPPSASDAEQGFTSPNGSDPSENDSSGSGSSSSGSDSGSGSGSSTSNDNSQSSTGAAARLSIPTSPITSLGVWGTLFVASFGAVIGGGLLVL